MGILRLLLAAAVVVSHSTYIPWVSLPSGPEAVQSFYLISGFYMTLILDRKYVGPGSYGRFLSNRALRLFPIYWLMLGLTVACAILYRLFAGEWLQAAPFVQWRAELSLTTWLYLAVVNLAIVGQDWLLFLGLNPATGTLYFTPNFYANYPAIYDFLLVPQAWSVGLELSFYLLAPWIVRRSAWVIGGIIGASLLLRAYIYWGIGWHFDPWTYRFFPTELAFFLTGALAFRAYQWLQGQVLPRGLPWLVTLLLLGLTCTYEWWFVAINYTEGKAWLYYGLLTVALPFLFLATRTSKLDRWVGELSYPIYMVHMLVITLLRLFNGPMGGRWGEGTVALFLSILLAVVLLLGVVQPIEAIRQRRAAQPPQPAFANPRTAPI